ncbi:MAG: glutathione S-transferase family protein [Burkholderiales bacterium]|nr:glutathione S-transferase family protein [Burkholderiales bacterium]
MTAPLLLYGHPGCPYVQRVAIVLAEKGVPHERQDIDFQRKPAPFLAASPLGQVPVLLVAGQALFDSAVICEWLDECHAPRLHPADALQRARHRAWMAYGTALLHAVDGFYKARDVQTLEAQRAAIVRLLQRLEAALGDPPYFAGAAFGMVDVVFAPVFRYFDAFARLTPFAFFAGLPKATAWRQRLAARPSVQGAVGPDFVARLAGYIGQQDAVLARQAREAAGHGA